MIARRRLRRAAPGRERAARARRRRERRRVLRAARGGAAVAARRARALRELAVRRRRRRPGCSRTARRSSPSCRAPARRRRSARTPGWEAWVERLVALGVIADYTRIWWDVRPHPQLRHARDPHRRPADVARAHGAARRAIVRDLVARRAGADGADRGDYLQNRWAAARVGLDAELIHPDGDRARAGARARPRAARRASRREPEAFAQLARADRRRRGPRRPDARLTAWPRRPRRSR